MPPSAVCRRQKQAINRTLDFLELYLQVRWAAYARAASGQDHQRGVHSGSSPCSHRHYLRGCQASHCSLYALSGGAKRPYDVTVNCIAPAPAYTGRFLATRVVADQEELPRLRRVAQPEDMAQIMLFLAGPQSDFLTGETIVCWAE